MKKALFVKHWLRVHPDKVLGSAEQAGILKAKRVPVLLAQVRDDQLEQAITMLAKVVDSMLAANGTVLHIISSIVIGAFDFGFDEAADGEMRCEATAQALHQILGKDGKILYGMCDAIYGNLGSPRRLNSGPFIRGIGDCLEQLRTLEFGAVRQL